MPDKKIKCIVNGQTLHVKEGTKVIEVFKLIKNPIAHYCWHPGLSVAGVCRLCMVEIEGIPKLQIACNTEVKEGMNISNQSEKVKEAVKWGLEFHLINHPLDCPICDQAGECELQEQYMDFGKYNPNMSERKVKKRKVIDLGPKVVLDSERCILCSRCVRFTDEVSQTNELGIFHRGDRSEIGIFKDKPLSNEYALNTVDICPVGALTSKDFRFRQRVWYLKTADSICIGCSTGCNVYLDYNEEGLFRVRPRYNSEVNDHWMCDRGRDVYRLPNKTGRLLQAKKPEGINDSSADLKNDKALGTIEFLQKIRKLILNTPADKKEESHQSLPNNASSSEIKPFLPEQHGLVVTAQYMSEEYKSFIEFFVNHLEIKNIFYWKNNIDSFDDYDGLLLRGDKNPNTKGLLKILEGKEWEHLTSSLESKKIKNLWVMGPENQKVYPDIKEKLKYFEDHFENIIWWTAHPLPMDNLQKTWQIPAKTFFEKTGTFINALGLPQKIKAVQTLVPAAFSIEESISVLKTGTLSIPEPDFLKPPMKTNHFNYKKKAL